MNLTNTYPALVIVIALWVSLYFIRRLRHNRLFSSLELAGLGMGYAVLGAFLAPWGAFVSLTWPFPDLPQDPTCCKSINIIFGESSWWVALLLVMLGLSLLLAALKRHLDGAQDSTQPGGVQEHHETLSNVLLPFSFGLFFTGAAMIPMGVMGLIQGKFAPPPNEWYAFIGKSETYLVSIGIFLFIGAACMLLAITLWSYRRSERSWLPGALSGFGVFLLFIATLLLTVLTLAAIAGHINLAEAPV